MRDGLPSQKLLRAYAAGATGAGVSLAIAAHLTYSAESRRRLRVIETISGAMLAAEEPVAAETPDMLDGDVIAPTRPLVEAGPLPRPVADYVGRDFDDIPWRFLLPGVQECRLEGDEGEEVSLLRVRPGAAIPKHTHEAEELTVIFDGELCDRDRNFTKGELAIADPSVDHHPRAVGDRHCVCLAVLTGGLRFTGPFGRALNLFN